MKHRHGLRHHTACKKTLYITPVFRISKKSNNAPRNLRTYLLEIKEFFFIGSNQPVQGSEVAGQDLCKMLTHITDAKRIDKTVKRGLLALFHRSKKIVGRFFRHTFKPANHIALQGEKVCV